MHTEPAQPRPSNTPTNSIGCAVSQPPRELHIDSLYGSPLIQELIKLATATVAYYVATSEGLKFVPPSEKFRTTANIEELIRFSLKDNTKPHIVMYAQEVLRRTRDAGVTDKFDFAKIAVTTYCDMQSNLAENSSWTMPTPAEVMKNISASCSRNVTIEELKRLGNAKDPGDITNISIGTRPY